MKSIYKNIIFAFILLSWCGNVPVQADATVSQIASGNSHVLFLKTDGSLWTAGINLAGQTGNPTTYLQTNPTVSFPIELVSNNVTAITGGGDFSLFIKSDGSLWGVGSDASGQLGISTFASHTNIPTKMIGSNVVAVSAGVAHTVFRAYTVTGPLGNQTINMLVEAVGNDQYGQLGNNSTKTADFYSSPVTVEFESTKFFPAIAPVCAGSFSSFFVKTDGTLWGMGYNHYGELGDGTTNTPPGIEQVAGAANVTTVGLNGFCTLFLESDGSLWGMGYNEYGQSGGGAGHPTNYFTPHKIIGSNVVAFSIGDGHSLFLKTDSSLWGMGLNEFGELGAVPLTLTYPSPIMLASNVVNFDAGSYTTYYTKSDGTTWASGLDQYGQLGDGFAEDTTTNLAQNYFATNAVQIFPTPPAVFTSAKMIDHFNLQIKATCPVGGVYSLVTSINIKSPLNTWTAVAGATVTTRGPDNFVATVANDGSGRQRFFALVKTN